MSRRRNAAHARVVNTAVRQSITIAGVHTIGSTGTRGVCVYGDRSCAHWGRSNMPDSGPRNRAAITSLHAATDGFYGTGFAMSGSKVMEPGR